MTAEDRILAAAERRRERVEQELRSAQAPQPRSKRPTATRTARSPKQGRPLASAVTVRDQATGTVIRTTEAKKPAVKPTADRSRTLTRWVKVRASQAWNCADCGGPIPPGFHCLVDNRSNHLHVDCPPP